MLSICVSRSRRCVSVFANGELAGDGASVGEAVARTVAVGVAVGVGVAVEVESSLPFEQALEKMSVPPASATTAVRKTKSLFID